MKAGDILIGSSITKGCIGLKLITSTAIPTAKKAWQNAKLTCYFATPVYLGKHTYLVTGTNPLAAIFGTEATLRCIETGTGKELWKKGKVGKYHASLLRTGDDKLLMLEEKGRLVLFAADPKGYRELASSKVCGKTWAHPAISDGRLYIRDNKELICVDLP